MSEQMQVQLHFLPTTKMQPAYLEIPLDRLPENKDLPGDQPDRRLVDSIKRNGVLNPIIVVDETSKPFVIPYRVLDGRTRIKALRQARREYYHDRDLGKPLDYEEPPMTVPSRAFPSGGEAGWADFEVLGLIAQEQRRRNPLSELLSIEGLMERGYSDKQICAATGMAPSTFARRLKLRGLTPDLRALLDAGLVTASWAESASVLSKELQEALVAQFAERGTLTKVDIKQARQVRAKEFWGGLDDPGASGDQMEMFPAPGEVVEYHKSPGWLEEAYHRAERLRAIIPADHMRIDSLVETLLYELRTLREEAKEAKEASDGEAK
jgi:AraC-like DNA-binding protein